MKIIFKISLIFFLLSINNDSIDKKNEHFIEIKSINPSDANFTDLLPLINVFKNKEIILLGEQSHGDGSTFEAKTRLIKFLHEKLEFNIILFESHFYDCYKSWEDIINSNNPYFAFTNSIYPLWSKSTQVKPLFDYIVSMSQSPHPLELGGFDCNNATTYYLKNSLILDLEKIIKISNKPFNEKYLQSFKNFYYTVLTTQFAYNKEYSNSKEFKSFILSIDKIINYLNNVHKVNKNQLILLQYFRTLKYLVKFCTTKNNSDYDDTYRDSLMYDNLLFLKEKVYKNKKIIIWAASAHLLKNAKSIELFKSNTTYKKPFGEYLNDKFGEKIYSLGFTAAYGKMLNINNNKIVELNNPTDGSIEDILLKEKKDYIFVDFNNKRTFLQFNKILECKVLGNIELKSNWTDQFGGIFFIKTLEPSNIVN